MQLENSFEVSVPSEAAWKLLTDVPAVLPCMPGAELLEILDDDRWRARLQVRLGPISLQFMADLKREATDLGALARDVIRHVEGLRGRVVHIEAPSVMAELDPGKVERIVENLLANAVRHTPPGTPIWVRVRAEEGGALICVEDVGPGVPEDQRATIFEPFRQGGVGDAHRPGVGVGLSLVARFAELHGGRAWVEDRPGGGASFRVLLPGQG